MNRFARSIALGVMTFAFLSGGFVSDAKAQGVLNEILKRMDAHQENLQTLKASVEMAKTNTQLNITSKQKGSVNYITEGEKDVAVRIDWTDPEEVLSVVNGKYTLYQPRLKQYITGKTSGSKNAKADSALAFMSMSKKELTANYSVKYLGTVRLAGAEVWHLSLTPKSKQSYKSAELWVDFDGMPLQAKIKELNNDLTTVRLSNLKKNVKIDSRIFKLDTKGARKIEG